MAWFKDAALDIGVTVLVVVATIFGAVWAKWILLVYTPLMLLMKMLILFSGSLLTVVKRPAAQVPTWFFHLLYAVNVAVLMAAHWWWLGAAWLLIWVLSAAAELQPRTAPRPSAKPKRARA